MVVNTAPHVIAVKAVVVEIKEIVALVPELLENRLETLNELLHTIETVLAQRVELLNGREPTREGSCEKANVRMNTPVPRCRLFGDMSMSFTTRLQNKSNRPKICVSEKSNCFPFGKVSSLSFVTRYLTKKLRSSNPRKVPA